MNDIDTMPIKCHDCPYWEIAEKPYNCKDCENTQRELRRYCMDKEKLTGYIKWLLF